MDWREVVFRIETLESAVLNLVVSVTRPRELYRHSHLRYRLHSPNSRWSARNDRTRLHCKPLRYSVLLPGGTNVTTVSRRS